MSIKGFMQNGALEKYDYNALENLPTNLGGGYVDENNIIVLGGAPIFSNTVTEDKMNAAISEAIGNVTVEFDELDEVIG